MNSYYACLYVMVISVSVSSSVSALCLSVPQPLDSWRCECDAVHRLPVLARFENIPSTRVGPDLHTHVSLEVVCGRSSYTVEVVR